MALAYPIGDEPDFWDPDPSERTHRFALGNVARVTPGAPPLVAICMNPSHASEREADRTVLRIVAASHQHGYPGWIMLNVYPQRSPKPKELSPYDPGLSAANCAAIERVLTRFGVASVLAGWGNLPHRTLKAGQADVARLLSRLGVEAFTLDALTKHGNPRHPSPPGRPLPMLGPKIVLR